jgi:transposase
VAELSLRRFQWFAHIAQQRRVRSTEIMPTESQWLLKLHTYGLLNNSFQPPSKIRTLRTYWRPRLQHVTGAATCVQRMQKALTQMNIQLANVISDLSGMTGQLIVRAIVAGERDPWKLAELSHPRIQASRAEIAKSLEGNWRQELIFVLQQEIEMYDTYQRRVAECDQELQKHLRAFADTVPPPAKENLPPKRRRNKTRTIRTSISPMNCSASPEWI